MRAKVVQKNRPHGGLLQILAGHREGLTILEITLQEPSTRFRGPRPGFSEDARYR